MHDGFTLIFIQHFEGPYKPQDQQKWPIPRGLHSAACLVDPQSVEAYTEQRLLVLWGQGPDAKHVPDIWVLHIHTMTWKEVCRYSSVYMCGSMHNYNNNTVIWVHAKIPTCILFVISR